MLRIAAEILNDFVFSSPIILFLFLVFKILKTYQLMRQINQTQLIIVLSSLYVSNSSFGKYVANLRNYMMSLSFKHIVLDPTKYTA